MNPLEVTREPFNPPAALRELADSLASMIPGEHPLPKAYWPEVDRIADRLYRYADRLERITSS